MIYKSNYPVRFYTTSFDINLKPNCSLRFEFFKADRPKAKEKKSNHETNQTVDRFGRFDDFKPKHEHPN
ncbi:hypothetical protein HanPSC8_Chr14g0605911 [Helianthus annuus]|nr:hypothetical protein HanPSC8_Chr14g0605911 [Helianthus annuus]